MCVVGTITVVLDSSPHFAHLNVNTGILVEQVGQAILLLVDFHIFSLINAITQLAQFWVSRYQYIQILT